MAVVLKHPQSLPETYYRYIGEVVFRWTLVEEHMQTIIWHVMGLDWKQGRLLTFGSDASQKIDMFRGLALNSISKKQIQRKINSIASRADKLNTRRNRVVHGTWGYKSNPKDLRLFYIANVKQRITPKTEKKNANDLMKIASDIGDLDARLIALHEVLGVPIP